MLGISSAALLPPPPLYHTYAGGIDLIAHVMQSINDQYISPVPRTSVPYAESTTVGILEYSSPDSMALPKEMSE